MAEPPNPLLRAGHAVYFGKVVPLIGGALSDKAAYRYLPKSVAYLPEPDTMLRWLGAAGFVDVHRALLSTGIAQLITATRARRVDPVSDSAGLVARTAPRCRRRSPRRGRRRGVAVLPRRHRARRRRRGRHRDGHGPLAGGFGRRRRCRARPSTPTTGSAFPGADRSRSARCRSCPTPPAPCGCPRCSSAGPTTAPGG
ncbi:MAG: class I SAM-dependent methyltransferase [Acidimicrobiales bacterium]